MPYRQLTVAPISGSRYISAPGYGGAHEQRRIDVSSSIEIRVKFTARFEHIAVFVLAPGVPLIWPVPRAVRGEDIIVDIEHHDARGREADVHVMDHWEVG